jgi:starch phosphorylase
VRYTTRIPSSRHAIDLIACGRFSGGDRALFGPMIDKLLQHDPYMLLADFASYCQCREAVGHAFQDVSRWTRMSISNVDRIDKFSSDRTIREYRDEIWRVQPVAV